MKYAIQAGTIKCLLILGIMVKDLPVGRSLTYEDLEPIELIPVEKSNGEIVYEQLVEAAEKTGVPRAIVADYGSDIKSGITKYCEDHLKTCYIYDIKHKCASILKKLLGKDERWKEYTSNCASTKLQVLQTRIAHILPPTLKSKARYMNVDEQIKWGLSMLTFLEVYKGDLAKEETINQITPKLKWLEEFKSNLVEWNNVIQVLEKSTNFVRNKGHYYGAEIDLAKELDNATLCEKSKLIKSEIVEFVQHESDKAEPTGCCYKIMWHQLREDDKQEIKKGQLIVFERVNCEWIMHYRDRTQQPREERIKDSEYATLLLSLMADKELSRTIGKSEELKKLRQLASSNGSDTQPDEKLLGSSESIESLFGKQKVVENIQSASGFTGLILCLPALTSKTDVRTVMEAMNETSVESVLEWTKEKLGKTLQSKVKELRDDIRKAEQKRGQLLTPI